MDFAKYHGIGNDFILIADLDDRLTLEQDLVRRLCDRRFGIGGDGVIRLAPGREGDFFMDYSNSDGSIGEMCGNGIRCLALFARDEGLTSQSTLQIDTRAGLKTVEILDGTVRVDMGAPIFAAEDIPVDVDGGDPLNTKLATDHGMVEAACLSVGNPHAVLFVDDPLEAPVTTLGPLIENHPAFPNKVNVEFAAVESADRVGMRVWERGSGETLACGTGACAVAVASRILANVEPVMTIALPGGELQIEWQGSVEDPAPIYMTGPAVRAFDGEFDIEAYS